MKFADLEALPFDESTDVICRDALYEALPNTSPEVLEQVFRDHGRKSEFQALYGHLELNHIQWTCVSKRADELCRSGMNEQFRPWFNNVAARATHVATGGWETVDVRADVQKQWETEKTWLRAPVFLDAHLVARGTGLFLVEGHTRLGLLSGLMKYGIVPQASLHTAWVGTFDGSLSGAQN